MPFVIRSMSTTDMDWRTGSKPEPYHVYLQPREKRAGAWWSSIFHAQRFETIEEAEAEWRRIYPEGPGLGTKDIAPVGHDVPIWVAKYHVPA